MPDLKHYREKRDPVSTPEPFGAERPSRALAPGAPRAFVVQQHAARNMHWDLRLEIGEVLVSWAVPRGPSADSKERRLAVQTEDHPMEYADFEGVIPAGNYGAGAMIVWDRGTYRVADGVAPERGLESGKLDLAFEGHKLRGRFALVRTRGEGGRQWLLIAKNAAGVDGELVEVETASVYSGLTIEEVRDEVSADAELEALLDAEPAPVRALDAGDLKPMLAETADAPFSREGWLFELKYDGVRVGIEKRGDQVRVHSRRGRDVTGVYPEVTRAARHLPVSDAFVDGEVVALDARGRSSFELLQRRFTQSDPAAIARAEVEVPVVFYAFDLPSVLGRDLRGLPLATRKRLLAEFAPRKGVLRFADHVEGDGEALYEVAREHSLEGVVAKRADSRYEAGRRSRSWQKVRVPRSAPLAIVGYLKGRGARESLGSLMVAWVRDERLVYAGSVGSGLDEATIDRLRPALDAARVDAPGFDNPPDPPPRPAVYVRPELACRVRFTEVTSAGLLRQPVFEGLEDVDPLACAAPAEHAEPAEAPAPAEPPEPDLQLTRLDKVFWPVEGYTKGDLLAYYEAVWPWLEPYLRDRPVVLTRYPDGIEGKNFYQKNAPDFTPSWARHEDIEGTDYFICNDLRTLLYVINSGAIPLHVWSARLGALDQPDWLILDLDPKAAPFAHVVTVARHIHGLLRELDTPHHVKTSGQDGIHVLVPLGGRLNHAEARALGEVLARAVCADLPDITTVARPLAARGDKVYVDFLQNGRGKLIASPFSVRPRRHAPVSMPLAWSQVTARLDPARWTIATAPKRLRERGDPMRPVLDEAADVELLLGSLAERLARAAG